MLAPSPVRNNRRHLRLLMIAALVLSGCAADTVTSRMEQGTFRATGLDLESPVALNGQWRFVPGIELDAPASVPGETLVPVPSDWNGYETGPDAEVAGMGSGTFILDIIGLPVGELGIYTKDQGTAYALYYQDRSGEDYGTPQPVISNGVASSNPDVHRPEYQPRRGAFSSTSGQGRLIVTVSNFDNRSGGMWNPVLLGTHRSIKRYSDRQVMLAGFSLGVLFFMGLNYLFYYTRRHRELPSLLLSLFSFTLVVRQATVDRLYSYLLPPVPPEWLFEWIAKAELISTYMLVPLFFFLVYTSYRQEMVRAPGYILAGISTAAILFTLVTPLRVHSYVILYYQSLIFLCGLYTLYVLVHASARKRSGARVALAGFGVFFATIINDILSAIEFIQSPYLAPYGFLAFLLAQSFQMSVRYGAAIESIEGLNKSLFRFVPREFIRNLGKESIVDVQLGDAIQREMTILFSDIRSFTSLSERMTPQENFLFLNSYLKRVSPVIRSDGGYIDKYLGDGIMALFPEKPADAVRCSLRMLETLAEYNGHRHSSGYDPIEIGIGIHSGRIILGTVGETERIDGTVIADAVNVASRLEGMNKEFGSSILISEAACAAAEAEFSFPRRLLGLLSVRGKAQPMKIYEIVQADSEKAGTIEAFEQAVELFLARRVQAALAGFTKLQTVCPNDGAVRYYRKKCEAMINS